MDNIVGIVERVTYHNQQNGWSVIKIKPIKSNSHLLDNEQLITVTLHRVSVHAGATMKFEGSWVEHPDYGTQFKALKATEEKPADIASLERYLGSGMLKGIGPVTAKKIVRKFGINTLEIFENNIEKLKEIKGITEKKLKEIKESWQKQRSIKDLMLFLHDHGISPLLVTKIFKTYGERSLKIVKENPYKLARDVVGIGFFTADTLAKKLGLDPQSSTRYRAGINHVLFSARDEGHCYLLKDQIITSLKLLLFKENESEFQEIVFERELQEMLEQKQFIKIRNDGNDCYFAHGLNNDESFVAAKILSLMHNNVSLNEQTIINWLTRFISLEKIKLSQEQQDAVLGILQSKVSILTGGPGCGKTTTTKAIVKALQFLKYQVVLCAPTGRAAQRMSEVIGINAQTIHRLLGFDPSSNGFLHNESNQILGDFFIIDESSMLDISLVSSLLQAVPEQAKVLFIGDIDQLPAVGPGNVLKDIIASKVIPVFRLSKIFRQENESSIITTAHSVNQGLIPPIASPFEFPSLWQNKTQSMFIDCEEITQEQVRFIQRAKGHFPLWKSLSNLSEAVNDDLTKEDLFKEKLNFPEKWQYVSMENLMSSKNEAEEVKAMLKKIHPFSAIHYGMTAQQMILRLIIEIIPKYYGTGIEVQLLSPMHKGSLGTSQLNQMIQQNTNANYVKGEFLQVGQRIFTLGDRVIHKKNNYDLDVFNGDIGKIIELNNEENFLKVEYISGNFKKIVHYEKESLLELELAYAISIHKSQGSEFDIVIIPLSTQHFTLLNRNLIYTALTRAKKLVIFIGSRKALSLAIKNTKQNVRQTLLKQRLNQESNIQVDT